VQLGPPNFIASGSKVHYYVLFVQLSTFFVSAVGNLDKEAREKSLRRPILDGPGKLSSDVLLIILTECP
jgi:hypothetical protein